MKLSLKQKALLQTLTLVGTGLATGASISLIFIYLSLSAIFITLGLALLGYMFYIVYQINLSQLAYKETLNEMTEKKG